MSKQTEALKRALHVMRNQGDIGVDEWIAAEKTILEALEKEALHKLAAESLNEGLRLDDWDKIGCVNHDCDKCKAQQEPLTEEENSKLFDLLIEEMLAHSYQGSHDYAEKVGNEIRRMYKAALREALAEQPAQQEPVGEIIAEDMGRPFNAIRIGTHFYKEVPPVGTKLYTTPQAQPAREWVGLTFGEICECESEYANVFARNIEAKLKEKNT